MIARPIGFKETGSVLLTDELRGMFTPDVVEVLASGHDDFKPGDFAVCLPYAGIWFDRPRFAVGVDKARVYGFAPRNRVGNMTVDATCQLVGIMGETLRPTGSNVIIRSNKPADKVGGLYVPDSVRNVVNYGTIEAVGPGRFDGNGYRVPVSFEVGTYVLAFDTSNAVSFDDGDEIVTIIDAEAIHAVSE